MDWSQADFIPVVSAGIRVADLTVAGAGLARSVVLADKAYTSKTDRDHLRHRAIKATILTRTDQGVYRRNKASKRR